MDISGIRTLMKIEIKCKLRCFRNSQKYTVEGFCQLLRLNRLYLSVFVNRRLVDVFLLFRIKKVFLNNSEMQKLV